MAELPEHFEMPIVEVYVHGDLMFQGVCWCGKRTKVRFNPGSAFNSIREHIVAKGGVLR